MLQCAVLRDCVRVSSALCVSACPEVCACTRAWGRAHSIRLGTDSLHRCSNLTRCVCAWQNVSLAQVGGLLPPPPVATFEALGCGSDRGSCAAGIAGEAAASTVSSSVTPSPAPASLSAAPSPTLPPTPSPSLPLFASPPADPCDVSGTCATLSQRDAPATAERSAVGPSAGVVSPHPVACSLALKPASRPVVWPSPQSMPRRATPQLVLHLSVWVCCASETCDVVEVDPTGSATEPQSQPHVVRAVLARPLQPALRVWMAEAEAAYLLDGTPTVLVALGSASRANSSALTSALVRMRALLGSAYHPILPPIFPPTFYLLALHFRLLCAWRDQVEGLVESGTRVLWLSQPGQQQVCLGRGDGGGVDLALNDPGG
jgi:hypothetical protein